MYSTRYGVLLAIAGTGLAAAGDITFNKEILPILQKNCQTCHRPGEIGPMPLLTYQEARPWAKSIKAAVVTRKMPPWLADPKYGHFANDRSLSEKDIRTIVSWVDAGRPRVTRRTNPLPCTGARAGTFSRILFFKCPTLIRYLRRELSNIFTLSSRRASPRTLG